MFPSVVVLKNQNIQLDMTYQELQSWKAHIEHRTIHTVTQMCTQRGHGADSFTQQVLRYLLCAEGAGNPAVTTTA